ncbi:vomeronasal 1 receptor monDomV1R1215 [Monodelphis domestica]|uniref:Vomeronasal type-1 receptor n=1 Tax=Monodelphis domestica TaxID=13616 RepID=A0A5F8HKE6_MONDO|nr:vomeronasal 1 receptor monDomV1R1215 [Monodelphis domestica]
MFHRNIYFGIIFLSQTVIGGLANFFLLTLYVLNILSGHRTKLINLILAQLTLANFTMLLIKGVPQILYNLGWNNFLNDSWCKVVFYLHRVGQGLSLSFTCLLCVFQAITISPSDSRWVEFKAQITKYIIHSCPFCCILNLLIEIPVAIILRGPRTSTNTTHNYNILFCSSGNFLVAYFFLTTLRNVLCVGLTIWFSSYMVYLLYRHHKKMKTICSKKLSPRASPEGRATQTILLLMCVFVCFYSLNSILTIYIPNPCGNTLWLLSSAFLSLCYPTFSPFILIPQASRLYSVLWARKHPHSSTGSKSQVKT